jgi:hypothetical protein
MVEKWEEKSKVLMLLHEERDLDFMHSHRSLNFSESTFDLHHPLSSKCTHFSTIPPSNLKDILKEFVQ